LGLAEPFGFELAEEHSDCLVDDLAQVRVGVLVAEEGLGPAELVPQLGAGREGDLETRSGDRLEHRPGGHRLNHLRTESFSRRWYGGRDR